MEHLNGCLHAIISMWKFYTCVSMMFPFSFNKDVRVLLCFHTVFVGSFHVLNLVFFLLVSSFFNPFQTSDAIMLKPLHLFELPTNDLVF